MGRLAPAILLALMLLAVVQAYAFNVSGYRVVASVEMDVPAVSFTEEGVIGVATKLHVVVAWPGSGRVYVSAEPLTELDMQAAARMAVMAAAVLAGVDYRGYDYFFSIEANTSTAGGPSASGAMAVAVLAALTGARILGNASMTGMVEPDLSLGPVGGIPEKLEAMAREGKRVFVIPYGQAVTVDPATGRTVNVTALGLSMGVRVVEVPDIASAYRILTGHTLSLPARHLVEYPDWLRENLRSVARALADEARKTLSNITLSGLSQAIAGIVGRLVSEARSALNESEKALDEGYYYVAASRAFYAAIRAEEARLIALWSREGGRAVAGEIWDMAASAKRILEEVEGRLEELEDRPTLGSLQLLVVVRDRVRSGFEAVNETLAYLAEGDLEDAVAAAAYAKYRALTARYWLEAALHASREDGVIEGSRLRDAVRVMVEYAGSSLSYLSTLHYAPQGLEELLRGAEERLAKGELIDALSLAVRLLADTTLAMHSFFQVKPDLPSLRSRVLALASRAAVQGVEPLIAPLYVEYGDWFAWRGDADSALQMYEYAAAYSLLLTMLTLTKTPPPKGGHVVCSGQGRSVRTVTVTAVKPTTITVTGKPSTGTPTATCPTTVTYITPSLTARTSGPLALALLVAVTLLALVVAAVAVRRR